MDLGERLYELRKSKNLSQENIAEALNVTRQTVSKWETNQSTPDFDKIVPLCEILGIGVEELVTGEKPQANNINNTEEKILTRQEVREMSAKVVSTSVFIYIASIVFIMIWVAVFGLNPVMGAGIFLLGIAWSTARIIKHYMSVPKFEKTKEESQKEKILKQINNVIGGICIALYFIISFTTFAWHITWIIFVIYGLICQVTKLIFMLKEGEKNEE